MINSRKHAVPSNSSQLHTSTAHIGAQTTCDRNPLHTVFSAEIGTAPSWRPRTSSHAHSRSFSRALAAATFSNSLCRDTSPPCL